MADSFCQNAKKLLIRLSSLNESPLMNFLKIAICLRKKERKSIHPLNIDTYNNHYIRLNECDNIRKLLNTNNWKGLIKTIIWGYGFFSLNSATNRPLCPLDNHFPPLVELNHLLMMQKPFWKWLLRYQSFRRWSNLP